ncbi:hypothetical protein KIH39_17735 [Telmatocola sphagniphila]|uniref:Uncharacterized protein n=1 Tax=Telmatocola sphagniphila TaxID=1123043 RepID=A0A8E6EWY5_9BACT|nr:hypothetical protein [Telmatocola sphagniphila]QVL30686.1 hypothetical protein KIH39_17735 [Telmatocola sphagniphila]
MELASVARDSYFAPSSKAVNFEASSLYEVREILQELNYLLPQGSLCDLEETAYVSELIQLQAKRLRVLVVEAENRLVHSLVARRMARAIPHFQARLNAAAIYTRMLRRLVQLLEVADDWRVRIIQPQTGTQGLFHLVGIENNAQLGQELLTMLYPSALGTCALFDDPADCLLSDQRRPTQSIHRLGNWASPRLFPKIDQIPTAYVALIPGQSPWTQRLFPEMISKVEFLS